MSSSTWGNPNATKRVVLIHGLTGSSQVWHRIGVEFESQVIAPGLLGHGNARRGSDYSIHAMADELQPFFTVDQGSDHPYDIVVGHSLGGVVTCALFPHLKSARSVRVVLVDPPLEVGWERIAFLRAVLHSSLKDQKTLEDYAEKRTFPTEEDSIFGWLGAHLCDINTVDSILDQNVPWSFSHLLSTIPDNVKVIALAADPSKGAWLKDEDLKAYPHTSSKTIWGISHLIPVETPQAVIEAALERTTKSRTW